MTAVHTYPRPVIALDVDGVLNPDTDTAGFLAHPIHMPADTLPDTPFLRGGGEHDLTGTVRVNPGHGTWITALRERADVIWATTWEHAANTHLAPLLGIEPLEVGTAVATHAPRFGYVKNGDSAAWKAEALTERYPGRPIIWIDDSAGSYTRGWGGPGYLDTGAPGLILSPESDHGLTGQHMAAVEQFLDRFDDEGHYRWPQIEAIRELCEQAANRWMEDDARATLAPLRSQAGEIPTIERWALRERDRDHLSGHPAETWELYATGPLLESDVRIWTASDADAPPWAVAVATCCDITAAAEVAAL